MNKSKIFDKLRNGFKGFSNLMASIINFILLLVVYFIGVGIVAVIGKIVGKRFMNLKSEKSTWVERNLPKRPIEEYYRSF